MLSSRRTLMWFGLVGVIFAALLGAAIHLHNVQRASSAATVTVVFQKDGPPPYFEEQLWQKVKADYERAHPQLTINLEPVTANTPNYLTKIELMLRSASTAPDIVRVDSFQVGSYATAGYLAPLDSYLAHWPDYSSQWSKPMQSITSFEGHNYAVLDGTDVRLIWYNKDIFRRAGLPIIWQPHTWADVLAAARTIKARLPKVVPLNCYSGTPVGEKSSFNCFDMLLYGTNDPLYDSKTQKWLVSSRGFLASLMFVRQVYDSSDNGAHLLGPDRGIALNPRAGSLIPEQYIRNGAVAIDIDGSTISSLWYPNHASPWPQWQQVMGTAKFPTEFGQAPGYVTLSGGWAYAISAKSANQNVAFDVLKLFNSKDNLAFLDSHIGNLTPRKDVMSVPSHTAMPLSVVFDGLLNFTHYRPNAPAYPIVSSQIGLAMEHVMLGMASPNDAMVQFAQAVTNRLGREQVETR